MFKWLKQLFKGRGVPFTDYWGDTHYLRDDETVEKEVAYKNTPFPKYRQVVVGPDNINRRVLCEWDD